MCCLLRPEGACQEMVEFEGNLEGCVQIRPLLSSAAPNTIRPFGMKRGTAGASCRFSTSDSRPTSRQCLLSDVPYSKRAEIHLVTRTQAG